MSDPSCLRSTLPSFDDRDRYEQERLEETEQRIEDFRYNFDCCKMFSKLCSLCLSMKIALKFSFSMFSPDCIVARFQ